MHPPDALPGPAFGPLQLDPASGLAYRLSPPAPHGPGTLVLLLHGVGGRETDLADLGAGLTAADPGALVALVRGGLVLGPEQFGWFRVTFPEGEPRIVAGEAEDSRRALIRLVDRLQSQHGVEAPRTVIAGFSQGGILSASVALSAPERVGGFALLSGRILPELEPRIANREWLAHLRGFIAHGDRDRVLPPAWARRAGRRLADLGVPHATRLYPAGHSLVPEMQADLIAWIRDFSRAA